MTFSQLEFGETLAAGAVNAFVTAFFIGIVAGLIVKRYEAVHELRLQTLELEHQTRAALRATYSQLLVAQRRSRQASAQLAQAGGEKSAPELATKAGTAHDEFISLYHSLNLDASKQMWLDVRGLRKILDAMLERARRGDAAGCAKLVGKARAARQNLERSFRDRLGHEPLQERKALGEYDRGLAD
ncbi:hypothetical protein [Streptomyces sp. NPDC050759]|uniref:hypothetical protein n=1 Tax=Streptomyces sp. NPDC050759 TaxID=3365635 RepID=UPI0037B5D01B